jgi:hypothetical protein
MRRERKVITEGDLDVVGSQFGFKIIERDKGQTSLVEMYSEDDGYWHYTQSFAAWWLNDLIKACEEAKSKSDMELIMKY